MNRDVATPAGVRVNSIVLAFTLVAGMIVFLRMFTRFYINKRAGFEDACIGFAMASSIALAVMTSGQVMHGLGKHSSRLTSDELDVLLKAFWASVWIYNLTLTATKIAILVQYLRIFPVPHFRLACFAMLGVVVSYGAWAVASSILICNPVPFSWDKSIEGWCRNQLIIWFTNAGVNIAQDVVIFFMPFSVIRTLQIPRGQKKGLIIMFALSASVTLVSIIRLHTLDEISNSTDVSFDNIAHATLSAVEANVGIICACLPAMRPLLARSLPRYFSEAPPYSKTPFRDVERPKHKHQPSTSTRTNTAGTATSRTVTPRVHTLEAFQTRTNLAHEGFPLQTLQPSLSRTPSGRFSVSHGRPPPARLFNSPTHSRTESKSSTTSTARRNRPPPLFQPSSLNRSRTASKSSTTSTARRPRFQGRLDPLRMSPITPLHPPALSFGSDTRRPSALVLPPRTPRTPGADKRLPITPFPGQGEG